MVVAAAVEFRSTGQPGRLSPHVPSHGLQRIALLIHKHGA